jgi:hypothetical protein
MKKKKLNKRNTLFVCNLISFIQLSLSLCTCTYIWDSIVFLACFSLACNEHQCNRTMFETVVLSACRCKNQKHGRGIGQCLESLWCFEDVLSPSFSVMSKKNSKQEQQKKKYPPLSLISTPSSSSAPSSAQSTIHPPRSTGPSPTTHGVVAGCVQVNATSSEFYHSNVGHLNDTGIEIETWSQETCLGEVIEEDNKQDYVSETESDDEIAVVELKDSPTVLLHSIASSDISLSSKK